MAQLDDVIVAIVSHIALENAGAESALYLKGLLRYRYSRDEEIDAVLEILTDTPIRQYDAIVADVIDTRDPFLIRLCACLNADFHGTLLNHGAASIVPEAFRDIRALSQKIIDAVVPVIQLRALSL